MEENEAKKVVKQLSDFVNAYDHQGREFVEGVMKEHRTLQQSMFRLFMECIVTWSKLSVEYYDLRNEATVKTSKKIMDALVEYYGVPLI